MKTEPIKQISLAAYLSGDQEKLPLWLERYQSGQAVDIDELLRSRIVYNPGAGTEGAPIRVFNAAGAAHVFVYVDYGFSKEAIDGALSNDAFRGYHLIGEQTLSADRLCRSAPTYHLTAEELERVRQAYRVGSIPTQNAFGILKIYQRDGALGEEHGAWRFALLYLGADAIATYDVLFGNTAYSPFACIVDAYGFSGEYDHFARGSLIERIAQRTNRLPKYLLCAHHCEGWEGYRMLRTVGGSYGRFLWKKEE